MLFARRDNARSYLMLDLDRRAVTELDASVLEGGEIVGWGASENELLVIDSGGVPVTRELSRLALVSPSGVRVRPVAEVEIR
jgi:hypothetical protein